MYYTDITNPELQQYHGLLVPNFTIKLTDLLTSDLFKVETVITDSIYKVFPLFYTNKIISSNPIDKILENKCLICKKETDETYVTFISNPDESIQDYSSYATYFDIGDTLTTAEFNSIVSLLRHFSSFNDSIVIGEEITGKYGTYEFGIDGCTILDTGIVITDETIAVAPKVKLTNPIFPNSTYTLQLKVLSYDGVNILDDDAGELVITDLNVKLTTDEWVTIPLTDLSDGDIISLNTNLAITHDKTIIQDWITHMSLTAPKNIIQSGELDDIIVTVLDDVKGLSGKTIYFYEIFDPYLITLTVPSSIIQSGDHDDMTAKLKDQDGSLIEGETVYFYEVEEE